LSMAKTRKARPSILVPVVEEVPRISEAERKTLRASLDRARADIAAGNYDVVTAASLRDEFEAVFGAEDPGKRPHAAAGRRTTPRRARR